VITTPEDKSGSGLAAHRLRAVQLLGKFSPKANGVLPTLLALLDHPTVLISEEAVRALGQIGPDAKPALPKLELRLKAPQVLDRLLASECHMAD
jgi:hypothetical protein